MNTIAIEPSANPLKELENERIDFSAFVPYQVRTLLQSNDSIKKLNNFKVLIIGGAALDQLLINFNIQPVRYFLLMA
jgi:o-succinylbenzoate---CoA ligase